MKVKFFLVSLLKHLEENCIKGNERHKNMLFQEMELEEAASQNLTSSLWLLGNATDDSSNQLMMNCSLAQNGTEAFEHCQESAGKMPKFQFSIALENIVVSGRGRNFANF